MIRKNLDHYLFPGKFGPAEVVKKPSKSLVKRGKGFSKKNLGFFFFNSVKFN
jgi:hypothetical protein